MPPTAAPDERALMRAWVERGDESAVGALWDANQRTAVAVAVRVLRGAPVPLEDARDVADDAFMRALEHYAPDRVRTDAARPFRSLYLTITRNLAIDRARRVGREAHLTEAALPSHDPRRALDDGLDLRAALPRLKAGILDRYLPQDWRLLERWMAYRSEGVRVPWKRLTEEFPVEVEARVPFAAGATEARDVRPLDAAARVLNACPQAHVDVIGGVAADEDPSLATRRARVVARALETRLERRVAHDRKTGHSEPRLRPRAATDHGTPEVHFEVTRGRVRTPDALRMRVEKVLLGHARELLREENP